ncbi:MAG: hypothetical protein EOO01_11860 [Chitinophagaceae bacterium]|nr:MAG: hypothetical protein EOO01_11860 [Chitinophagaceae bacterium]
MSCFISCSSDDSSQSTTITTLPTSIVSGTIVVLRAEISGDGSIVTRGICWGTTDNPTRAVGNFIEENIDQKGTYEYQLTTLAPNTVYYARAYYDAGSGQQYGNTVTFTTGQFVSTEKATEIYTTKATLTGQKTFDGAGEVGFVYSTSHNPTTADFKVHEIVTPTGSYSMNLTGLTPNTTYYYRAYVNNSTTAYTYGVEKEFKTAGYFGDGGGYVAYDKGETVDGWRYLEVLPTTISYDITFSSGSQWGNMGSFVAGTVDNIGSGPANTATIASTVPQANCAAKLCQNLVKNGKSDWFLGSSEEMLLVTKSMYDAGVVIGSGGEIWTSTQANANEAKVIMFDFIAQEVSVFSNPKNYPNVNVLPLRRY